MLMKILILLSVLVLLSFGKICTQPQRGGAISFKALSSRDYITKVFYNIAANMSTYNSSAENDSQSYNISNLKPRFYYIDNSEINEFVDSSTANFKSGKLYLAVGFNYSFGNGTVTKGYSFARVLLDPFSFQKQLFINEGYLEWNPVAIENITMHSLFVIEDSTPSLSNTIRRMFQNILNDQLPTPNNMKDSILAQMNTLFQAELKIQLNNEKIIHTNNVTYTYKGTNLTYTNQLYYAYLYSDEDFKGLKYLYLFQLEGYMKNCNVLPLNPDLSFGGVQQLISMQTFKATFYFGLENGLFNAQLDDKWESPIFQFYAGDVANVIDKLSRLNPSTAVTGDCVYDRTLIGASIVFQSSNSVAATIPYRCTLRANNSAIQTITFNATFEVDFQAQNETLRAVIGGAYLRTVEFYSEGGYTTTDKVVGAYYILSVLRTTEGAETLGTGFPTQFRKFPLLKVAQNYTTIYDASEM